MRHKTRYMKFVAIFSCFCAWVKVMKWLSSLHLRVAVYCQWNLNHRVTDTDNLRSPIVASTKWIKEVVKKYSFQSEISQALDAHLPASTGGYIENFWLIELSQISPIFTHICDFYAEICPKSWVDELHVPLYLKLKKNHFQVKMGLKMGFICGIFLSKLLLLSYF